MAEPAADNQSTEAYFQGFHESRMLFDLLLPHIEAAGESEMVVSKTQISFRRRRAFAWVWIPEKHLGRRMAPLVLSVSLPSRDPSPRWKEIVEPYPGRFMHHLELFSPDEIDEAVRAWLRTAYECSGERKN